MKAVFDVSAVEELHFRQAEAYWEVSGPRWDTTDLNGMHYEAKVFHGKFRGRFVSESDTHYKVEYVEQYVGLLGVGDWFLDEYDISFGWKLLHRVKFLVYDETYWDQPIDFFLVEKKHVTRVKLRPTAKRGLLPLPSRLNQNAGDLPIVPGDS